MRNCYVHIFSEMYSAYWTRISWIEEKILESLGNSEECMPKRHLYCFLDKNMCILASGEL